MAKLINVLAASVGGGLILGAGMRFAQASAQKNSPVPAPERPDVLSRLGAIEARLKALEHTAPPAGAGALDESGAGSAILSRLETHREEAEAVRASLALADRLVAEAGERSERTGAEVRQWAAGEISRQIGAAETRLRGQIEDSRKQTVDAVMTEVQTRVVQRISRLERDVEGQSTAMAELREYSIATEKSMQRLLAGIDRLVAAQMGRQDDSR